MKQLLALIFFSLSAWLLTAQIDSLLSETDMVRFTVTMENGQPALSWQPTSPDSLDPRFSTILELQLRDADLVIRYQLRHIERGFYYDMKVRIQNPEGGSFSPEPWDIRGSRVRVAKDFKEEKELIWANALEEVLDINRSYTLVLRAVIYGDLGFDCAEKPVFTVREQAPHYVAAAVGAGMIGIGHLFKAQADQDFEEYEDQWRNGSTENEAREILSKANGENRAYNFFNTGGIIVLGVDAIWYTYRLFRHRDQARRYRKYCPRRPDLELSPVQQSGGVYGAPEGMGVRLTVWF